MYVCVQGTSMVHHIQLPWPWTKEQSQCNAVLIIRGELVGADDRVLKWFRQIMFFTFVVKRLKVLVIYRERKRKSDATNSTRQPI